MAIVTKTRTYNTGDSLPAGYYNADRDEIITGVNAIDNAQISASAGILESKIAFSAGGHDHSGAGYGKKILVTNLDPTALTATYLLRVNALGTAVEAVSPTVAATILRAFGFYIGTAPLVTGTNLSWNPTVPENMTCVKLWGYVKTAPSGADVVAVVKTTGGTTIGTLTIPAGNYNASTTSFSTSALTAGMILQLDITSVGTSPAGDSLSVVLECSQP
jgi:hypothetical protein